MVSVCVRGRGGGTCTHTLKTYSSRAVLKLLPTFQYSMSLVSSPDLIRYAYRFQYKAWEKDTECAILKAICAGVGFGSGTETSMSHTVYEYTTKAGEIPNIWKNLSLANL